MSIERRSPGWLIVLTCLAVVPIEEVHATPSSDEILSMCERALENGYRGRPAQMCTWYVTPCDCDLAQNEMGRACVPDDIPSKTIAGQVVTLLKGLPEFRQADGAKAVSEVLAVRYPCENEAR